MHTVKSAVRQRLSVVQVVLEQASGLKSSGMARAHSLQGATFGYCVESSNVKKLCHMDTA